MKISPPEKDINIKQVQPYGFYKALQLLIPAYSIHKEGFLVHISVYAETSAKRSVTCYGHVAKSLENAFKRNIDILSSIYTPYEKLNYFHFKLISQEQNFRVKDVRSASFPITITLLNLLRLISGKKANQTVIGTGILRIDGSFAESNYENIKKKVINQKYSHLEFTNSNQCNHVFELEYLLNHR